MAKSKPIAIIGVGALLPGSAGANGFWRDIVTGKDLITDVPARRWLIEDHFDPNPQTPDKTYCHRGAFLSPVDFDPLEFGVPPTAIPATDTCQLLALMVAKWVLDDVARSQNTEIDRERAGVILGVTSGQELFLEVSARLRRPVWVKALRESGITEDKVEAICEKMAGSSVPWQENTFPGMLGNVVAGRIANRFDFHGTNCVTDAACASSLAAVSMAVDELRIGRSDLMLAGGADTFNDISMYVAFSKTPALSPTGDCRPFSDRADGTVLGEGFAMFALKRLDDAERDGNHIYAVIRGVGSSSDGKAKSIYAPLPSGQARAMRRAYVDAGCGPETVGLVEAHGTGTAAGDQAELESLKTVFLPAAGDKRQWCALGSVKSQVGHTKAASGAAGIFKAAMALHHKLLPPTIKVDRPNAALHLEESPFYLNSRSRPWLESAEHPRRAGVSSFGFGGTNFHVVLEEYQGPANKPPITWSAEAELILLSGADSAELAKSCEAMATRCETRKTELATIGYASQVSFDPKQPQRLAIVCASKEDLTAKLKRAAQMATQKPIPPAPGIYFSQSATPAGKIAFLFPGQGSQYPWMGADVAMAFPQARQVWDSAQWLGDAVFPPPSFTADEVETQTKRLAQTEVAQPALGAASLALLELLGTMGLRPDAVAGHSFGELPALFAAGGMDAWSLLAAARRRGELMAASTEHPAGMLSVAAGAEEVGKLLAAWKLDVVIANRNAPKQTVIAGESGALDEAKRRLTDAGLRTVVLPVSTAFHSPLMQPAAEAFEEYLKELEFHTPAVPLYSNLDGLQANGDGNAIAQRLALQIAAPVRFQEMIERMYADGVRTFVEVGAKDVLTNMVRNILDGKECNAIALDRQGANGIQALWDGLGRLSVLGVPLNYRALRQQHGIPASEPAPETARFTIPVDGGNVGRPYPPANGAAGIPKAIPPSAQVEMKPAPQPQPQAAPVGKAAVETAAKPAPKPAPVPRTVNTIREKPGAVALSNNISERLRAYEIFQQSISAAQQQWQENLSRGHESYLTAMEAAYASAMGEAQSVSRPVAVVAAPASAPVRQVVAPPPPVVMAQPQVVMGQPQVVIAPPPSPVAEVAPVIVAPVATPAAPAKSSGSDIVQRLAGIVADKTGYPAEMLNPDMALEADLGIDSIKRVEIFSALQEQMPDLPEIDPAQMGTLRTLGEIAALFGSFSPAPAAPAAVSGGRDLGPLLRQIVADKTGYPVEMLELSMALEADLGIDSIKRVEIFSALQEQVPELPEVDPAQMGTMRTLGDIVTALQGSVAPAAAPVEPVAVTAAAPSAEAGKVEAVLLEVIAEKTGYPVDILQPNMSLEADLGIDSIKRVEIFSAVSERLPDMPDMDPARMGALATIADVVAALGVVTVAPVPAATPVAAPTVTAPPPAPVAAHHEHHDVELPERLVATVREAPAVGHATLDPQEGTVVITSDGSGLDLALAKALESRGFRVVTGVTEATGAAAWISLNALRISSNADEAVAINRENLSVAQVAAKRLASGAGAFVLVQNTGGDFASPSGLSAFSAGSAGLARTAAIEWPKARVKVIDLETAGRAVDELARVLADELVGGGPEVNTGLRANGQRITIDAVPTPANWAPQELPKSPVVLATGGARGVTAASLIRLAESLRSRGGMRIALIGRTALVDEPAFLAGCADEGAIRKAYLASNKGAGKMTPAQIQAQVSKVLAAREVRATIKSIEAAGSQVRHLAVDVRDAAQLGAAVADLRRDWGAIDGVVHGAGVLADRKITDLSLEQFDAVFSTKVGGLQALLDVTAQDQLRFLILFSSVASRYGNAGQAAYAMANEVLNKVACAESKRRGPASIVKSICWGPWDGGMVTPTLSRHFEKMGVPLMPVESGAEAFVEELTGGSGQVEIVRGAQLPTPPGELQVRISQSTHPHLSDHQIKDVPVLPVAEALNLFLRSAAAEGQGAVPDGQIEIKVLNGVRLNRFYDGGDLLVLRREGDRFELVSDAGVRHYEARFSANGGNGKTVRRSLDTPLESAPWKSFYDKEMLFHGPSFQVVKQVDGVSEQGITGKLVSRNGQSWRHGPAGFDAGMMDGGLQFAQLWGLYKLQKMTLPMRIGAVRLVRPAAEDSVIECQVVAVPRKKGLVCDIAFTCSKHGLLATMTDVEMYVVPGA